MVANCSKATPHLDDAGFGEMVVQQKGETGLGLTKFSMLLHDEGPLWESYPRPDQQLLRAKLCLGLSESDLAKCHG